MSKRGRGKRGRGKKHAEKTAVLEWMLLRIVSEEPVSERKRQAFLEWLAEETDEEFKWDTMDRVFADEWGRICLQNLKDGI